ncbi:acyl-CoA dehydrogenase [Jannaschia sp. S6380]|uniref:acyl-CoA dehydrogenase n=1 Tax=Jannaschia sp. S6380 TaxID=2926408 RepID=UPI001FF63E49|nr:acyl-CoA dehydrogenase [Jannaschia sp. S6380]MCK0167730.1 acyl-CoA dehydrogenase [Jannaschia sp. S6380]
MSYRAPVSELRFVLDHVVGFDRVTATDTFAEATPETVDAILTEAGRMCADVLAPLNRQGDLHPARLENGVVRTSPGFADGFRAIAEGGWLGMSADPEHGGMGLPIALTMAVNEMMGSACLSLQLNPLMTQGQIEALEAHASDEIRDLYIPKLISGEWCGTMNLTEPQAGSDVGALRTKAVPNGDGTYAVTGQKIYISWGDNDFSENVCHLVLARLPDAVEGTKGISLFMVPKRIPDADGTLGVANSLKVVSLEHKLGLHGSPTAVMQYDGATGWLVGAPHKGMAAMFTMMNNARLGVGVQGLSIAEAAMQHAVGYALERRQGKTASGDGTILDHADVRRMILGMKAETFAARAIAMDCAVSLDMAKATGDAGWRARGAFLTPIAKTYGTETGMKVAAEGIQVHGGMGVIEETGAAQYVRDVRVTAIYEGTNGIQAMDLVGRKLMDGGAAAFALLDEVEAFEDDDLRAAASHLRVLTDWMVAQDMQDRFAGAVSYLAAFARVLGVWHHLKAAAADEARAPLARFAAGRLLPEALAEIAKARTGAGELYAVPTEVVAA